MGKWCLHASSFIFDRIIIKVAGNQDRHKSLDKFDFGPLVSMAYLYVFEMRFDLGTLDSGERSLPFGLLVYTSHRSDKGIRKIRFISTGENSRKPCLICKKDFSIHTKQP